MKPRTLCQILILIGLLVPSYAQAGEAPTDPPPPVETPPAEDPADGGGATPADAPAAPGDGLAPVEQPTPGDGTEAPAAPVETSPPAEIVDDTGGKPASAVRELYEYVEQLQVGPNIRMQTRMLVVVSKLGGEVTIELHPDPSRTVAGAAGAKPGTITFSPGGGSPSVDWPLAPKAVKFTFINNPKRKVSLTGVGTGAEDEARTVLLQALQSTHVQSGQKSNYELNLVSAGSPFNLRGRQENEKVWVDWTLSGAGSLETGKGWELPVSFVLDEQPLDGAERTLSAKAQMRYSSIRSGPENETTLATTLTVPGTNEKLEYVRSCKLEPLSQAIPEAPVDEPEAILVAGSFGGDASAWARTATLSTLGIQPLVGVRETGLAMWVAQLAIDERAGTGMSEIENAEARTTLSDLEFGSPSVAAPLNLIRKEPDWGLLRLEAIENFLQVESDIDGDTDSDFALVPDLFMAVRWKPKSRWRPGLGFDMIWASLDTQIPDEFWAWAAVSGRIEYVRDRWSFAFASGPMMVQYDIQTELRQASADLISALTTFEYERRMGRRWAGGLRFQWAGGADLTIMRAQPTLRWWYRKNVALQMQAVYLTMVDSDAIGGEVSATGTGVGIGVAVRW